MANHHRYRNREGVGILRRSRQTVRHSTEVLESTRLLCYLPPRRLAVVVFVNVPERIFTPIRTIAHYIADIARAAGDDAPTDIAAVVFAGFVDATTPRRNEVGADFHRSVSLGAVKNDSGTIVEAWGKIVKVSTNLDKYATIDV